MSNVVPRHTLRRAGLAAVVAAGLGFAMLPSVSAVAADADPVVAVVNGEKIKRSELEAMKARVGQQIPQLGMMPLEAVFEGLLDRAIDQRLLVAAGKKSGLEKDPDLIEQLEQIRQELIQRAYLQKEVEKRLTDARLKQAYDQMVKDMPAEDEIKARHILLDSEEAAKDVIAQVQKGGDFAKIAEEKSTGPSGPRGGDLGWFTKGTMVPEFSDAAFGLKAGEITTTPVKTQFGWHVIKVEDRRKAQPPSFDEAKEDIRAQLAEETVTEVLADLRKGAKVETFALDGSKKAQ
ncbi:peptidylprolyl isomerase [Novispirillum sp. DQ9]|uniref:foldase protein PrsA n=1 Tax=Novispirillum sp. DQ9 TaxID=3398612 RepID=UPI003C7C60E6